MEPRIGFLGCGLIAGMHAGMLAGCGEAYKIGAVHDPERERAEAFAAKWNGTVVSDEAAVIDQSDVLFVCTWTSAHAALVEHIAAAGKHVYCEKPLAFDADHAQAMQSAVERAGVVNMVGLILRSTPACLALCAMIAAPASGRVMNVVFRDDQYIPVGGMYDSDWRADPERAGRGTLLEHSIHDIDLLEWLVGPVASVNASEGYFHELPTIEDSVSAVLRFAVGGSATLTSVWHDIASRPSQRRIEVFCENALYTLEGEWSGPLRWETSTESGALEGNDVLAWLTEHHITVELPHTAFLRAIRDGKRPQPSFAAAVRAHQVVDALYRSAASGSATVEVS